MASEYLERSNSARKSMGPAAKKERRKQSRAANEAVAFVAAGPKETRGKYADSGANPYGMIASAILKGATRMVKPVAENSLARAAKITAANEAKFNASIFNAAAKSPSARGSVNRVVTNAVTRAAQTGSDDMFARSAAQNTMRLGGEVTDAFRLQRGVVRPQEYDVIQRGMAKILGRAGRVDPAYREIGRDLRLSSRKTFTSNLGKRMK